MDDVGSAGGHGRTIVAGVCAMVCAGTAPLRAQAVPAGSTASGRGLAFGAAAETGYESNPRFVVPDGVGSMISRVRLTGAASTRTPRTRAELSASGEAAQYPRVGELNRVTYDVAGAVARALSPRVAGTVRATARTSVTADAGVVTASPDATASAGTSAGAGGSGTSNAVTNAAVPFVPVTVTRTQEAAAALAYRVTRRTDVSLDVQGTRVRYGRVRADTMSGGSAFVLPGGTSVAARTRATRRLASDATAGLAYAVAHTTSAGQASQTLHAATVDAELRFASAYRAAPVLRGTVGAATLVTRGAETLTRPTAEASLSALAGGATFTLLAAHAPAPVLGVGRVLVTDRVGAQLARALGPRLGLAAGAEAAWSDDPLGTLSSGTGPLAQTLVGGERLRATTLTSELHWTPLARARRGGGVTVTLGAFARDRRQTLAVFGATATTPGTIGRGTVATRGVTLTLAYGIP